MPRSAPTAVAVLAFLLPALALLWHPLPSRAQGDEISTVTPNTPQELAMLKQEDALSLAGEKALSAGDYLEAERIYRAFNSLDRRDAEAYQGMAEALRGQGKPAEAVQAYRVLIYQEPFKGSSIAGEVGTQMHYAIALTQIGRWREAVSVYEKTLPDTTHFGDAPQIDVQFDPRVPMPLQLQALAYVAAGMECTGHGETKEAFAEYEKASHLAPDSPFANYYYGYGWRDLSPKDKAKLLDREQAKAAFGKAALFGKGDLKKAAEKALKDLDKPVGKPA